MSVTEKNRSSSTETSIVIHGGAGSMRPDKMSEEKQSACRDALRTALQDGNAALRSGGSALDAVEAAITTMESAPLFNAARGAVLTGEGTVELEAAIMDGATRRAGALTGGRTVRHPIRAARTIMDASSHVMLAQDGAEDFVREQGLETVENEHFITAARRSSPEENESPSETSGAEFEASGTVGAVALDEDGNLAAGSSTGGTSGKHLGRVGDSPLIGAGTYAHNAACAVSATGQGEFFVRGVAAHNVAARVRFEGVALKEAARSTIDEIEALGGVGGVIALDRDGNIAMPFSTSGMFRACVDTEGQTLIRIFAQDSGE